MSDKTADRFVSGFISILGRPNAGKSTLLNALVGSKIAIVADRPQTTRTLIQGVLTLPEAQMVFIDTPGIHKPDTLFNRRMMETVRSALNERDVLLYLVDASVSFSDADEEAVRVIAAHEHAHVAGAEQNRPGQGQVAASAVDRAVQGAARLRRLHPDLARARTNWASCARRSWRACPKARLISRQITSPTSRNGSSRRR